VYNKADIIADAGDRKKNDQQQHYYTDDNKRTPRATREIYQRLIKYRHPCALSFPSTRAERQQTREATLL
jgi:hypothetical protein